MRLKLPEMHKVKSSNIEAMGWADGKMYVRFAGGRLYSYDDVPKKVYEGHKQVESIGSWFAQNIRGKYMHRPHDA